MDFGPRPSLQCTAHQHFCQGTQITPLRATGNVAENRQCEDRAENKNRQRRWADQSYPWSQRLVGRRAGGAIWRNAGRPDSGCASHSKPLPGRLHVSVDQPRGCKLEITICDFKFEQGPWWPTPPQLGLHRARSCDAFQRAAQRHSRPCEHRDHACLCPTTPCGIS